MSCGVDLSVNNEFSALVLCTFYVFKMEKELISL